MATITIKVCDKCRQEDPNDATMASHTEDLHVDQHGYSIDLCDSHHQQWQAFRLQVETWKSMAKVITGTSTAPRQHRGGADSGRRAENAELRAWAAANGHDVGERGRIPDALREQYRAEKAAEQAQSNGVVPPSMPMAGLPR